MQRLAKESLRKYGEYPVLMVERFNSIALGGDKFDTDKVLGYPLREFAEETGLNPKLVSTRIK